MSEGDISFNVSPQLLLVANQRSSTVWQSWLHTDLLFIAVGTAALFLNMLGGTGNRFQRLAAFLGMTFWVVLIINNVWYPYSIVPLLPFLALNSALAMHIPLRWLTRHLGFDLARVFLLFVLLGMAVPTDIQVAQPVLAAHGSEPQQQAMTWIRDNVPRSAVILTNSYLYADLLIAAPLSEPPLADHTYVQAHRFRWEQGYLADWLFCDQPLMWHDTRDRAALFAQGNHACVNKQGGDVRGVRAESAEPQGSIDPRVRKVAMHIHFVCTGNAYRSRLAEAYLRAQQLDGISVSSSGIQARIGYPSNGPVSWYALRLLQKHQLIPFMSRQSRQTTRKVLCRAQLVIFMQPQHYDWVRKHYRFEPPAYEIWEVPDVHEMGEELSSEAELIRVTERTFEQIKKKVERLAEQLRLGASITSKPAGYSTAAMGR